MKKWIVCLLAILLCGASALAEAAIGTQLKVVNCNEYITLREEPDTTAAELARMPLNQTAIALGVEENGFVRVGYQGQAGWALAKYLSGELEFASRVEVTDAQRYNLNLFLSNFTEADFCRWEGAYVDSWKNTAQLTDFALEHCWFNRQDRLEWGEYFNGNNVRCPESQVAPIVEKYFGRTISPSHTVDYIDYKNGYYYWEETGGHTSGGFACLDQVELLGEGRYRVGFHIYAGAENWTNDACRYTPSQAQSAYPSYDGWYREGFAVIDVGRGSLDDRSTWALTRYAVNYD